MPLFVAYRCLLLLSLALSARAILFVHIGARKTGTTAMQDFFGVASTEMLTDCSKSFDVMFNRTISNHIWAEAILGRRKGLDDSILFDMKNRAKRCADSAGTGVDAHNCFISCECLGKSASEMQSLSNYLQELKGKHVVIIRFERDEGAFFVSNVAELSKMVNLRHQTATPNAFRFVSERIYKESYHLSSGSEFEKIESKLLFLVHHGYVKRLIVVGYEEARTLWNGNVVPAFVCDVFGPSILGCWRGYDKMCRLNSIGTGDGAGDARAYVDNVHHSQMVQIISYAFMCYYTTVYKVSRIKSLQEKELFDFWVRRHSFVNAMEKKLHRLVDSIVRNNLLPVHNIAVEERVWKQFERFDALDLQLDRRLLSYAQNTDSIIFLYSRDRFERHLQRPRRRDDAMSGIFTLMDVNWTHKEGCWLLPKLHAAFDGLIEEMHDKYTHNDHVLTISPNARLVFFTGNPQSGAAFVGTALGLHPHALIANRLHLLTRLEAKNPITPLPGDADLNHDYLKTFVTMNKDKDDEELIQHRTASLRKRIFQLLISYNIDLAISRRKQQNNGYGYGEINRKGLLLPPLRVIGDSDVVGTTALMQSLHASTRLVRWNSLAKEIFHAQLCFIHVVRNPFDVISIILNRELRNANNVEVGAPLLLVKNDSMKETLLGIVRFYLKNADIVENLIARDKQEVHVIHFELLIANATKELTRLATSLLLAPDRLWLESVKQSLVTDLLEPRKLIQWPADVVRNLRAQFRRRSLLSVYADCNIEHNN